VNLNERIFIGSYPHPRSSNTSIFADTKANPDIQLGFEPPARKNALLVLAFFLRRKAMKITKRSILQ
jgi:hypothetical protein